MGLGFDCLLLLSFKSCSQLKGRKACLPHFPYAVSIIFRPIPSALGLGRTLDKVHGCCSCDLGQHEEQLSTNLQGTLKQRGSSQCTGGQDWDSEGAAQAAVLVWQEPHKGQGCKCKPCTLERIVPHTSTGWGMNSWEAALNKNNLEIKLGSKVNKPQQCALAAKKGNTILGCLGKNATSRSRRVIHHFYSGFVRQFLECSVQNFGSPVQERYRVRPADSNEDNQSTLYERS